MNLETRVQDKDPRRQIREKRREARRQADGAVHVEFSNPQPVKIEGRLMDISANGFRIAHSYTALATGQVVDFSHSEASGHARVMWNRIMDQSVETGFLVIAA